MTTALVTCIYSRLFETDLNGRASREHHYKKSLKSIMKMNPDKVFCFTSEEEYAELLEEFKDFPQIEFIVFPLIRHEYHVEINEWKSKNTDIDYKGLQRNFEIQYQKFLWMNQLENQLEGFDRLYWMDAGLSHGHLYPPRYQTEYYDISLFTPEFLTYLNTSEKVIFVGKNNEGQYRWSAYVPKNIHGDPTKAGVHIIGGFFGGPTWATLKTAKEFENVLPFFLAKGLYMEEQIMTSIYNFSPDLYSLLQFDDWIPRDWHDDKTKLFYELFLTEPPNNKTDATGGSTSKDNNELPE